MSNTKDTPMDYKQFEGHTPGPWQDCEGDFNGPPIVAKFLNERQDKIRICECDFTHIRQAMAILSAKGEGENEFPLEDRQAFSRDAERANAKLIAAAPDLLKENQSLKLELQKQKELKDKLVNGLTRAKERIVYDNPNYEKYESTCCKSVILELESLIKKSSEI